MAVLSADSWLDMTHKYMLYKYLDSIWPDAPDGPIEGNFWAEIVYNYSATYSPNPDNPPHYVDLPMAFPSGELIQEVWDRWLSFDPVVNVHDRIENLHQLSGIMLDAGSNDDYNLHWGPPTAQPLPHPGGRRPRAPREPGQPRRTLRGALPGRAPVAFKNARTRLNAGARRALRASEDRSSRDPVVSRSDPLSCSDAPVGAAAGGLAMRGKRARAPP
jgi:hypothetical protein